MDELIVGKMYYVSENALEEAMNYRNTRYKYALCKCTSKRGKFKIRDGVYRYMKYWIAEKEGKMEEKVTDEHVSYVIKTMRWRDTEEYSLACALQDARKELEEAKKDSVWRDAPDYANEAEVYYKEPGTMYFHSEDRVIYTRTLPKTPNQELIDKFAEKNALAMKCANLSKEILEAFVKEYEEVMKPLDK